MDWIIVIHSVTMMDVSIVALIMVLAAVATGLIYNYLDTGHYVTMITFAVMSLVGMFGHVIFSMFDVFFSPDPARNIVIGAVCSMTLCLLVAIIAGRVLADTVYARYRGPEPPSNDRRPSTL